MKVQEKIFIEYANTHPILWRNIAVEIADRLKQRERFLTPKNAKPKLFVGCSVEDLDIARTIQLNLSHDNIDTSIWTDNVFSPSCYTIHDLISELNKSDFAVFIISGNDLVKSRNKKSLAPRDNVILEIGLFMGRLGNERVMMIKPRAIDLKIPSDLLGLRLLDYDMSTSNLVSALAPACFEIRAVINRDGVF